MIADMRHCSILCRALSSETKTCIEAFLASRLLNDSMNAFWIGLPGPMNCSRSAGGHRARV